MKAKDYKAVLLDLLIKYGVQATSARTTTDKSTDTKTVAYRVCGADPAKRVHIINQLVLK